MSKQFSIRLGVVALLLAAFVSFYLFDLGQFLTLEALKHSQLQLEQYREIHPWLISAAFVGIYILSTALSLPGATILTLAGGAIFGFWLGTMLVSLASTFGATLAFLVSRLLLRDFVKNRFGDKLESIDRGVEREGAFYLLSLRLVPIFPFFLINLAMGITKIRPLVFFFVSQIGMLPGTAAYVNAGTQLAKIETVKGILSPAVLISFAILGVIPLIAKKIADAIRTHRQLGHYKKPKQFDYNLVVIGAGSAGLVSSYIAAAVKAKVALIEGHKMGGDCLNTGCVPSKALIRSAKILNYFKRAEEFGIEATPAQIQFSKVMERVQRIIKEVEPHDSIERYTKLGVDCIQGRATVLSPYSVEVNGQKLTTRNIIIATGASPLIPPIPGLDKISYLTSDNVWGLRELPKELIILGGGPIGCELAQSFARFGSNVTVVEMAPRLLMREDEDVSQFLSKTFASENISVRTGHKAIRIDSDRKILFCEHDGHEVALNFDQLLVALGRKANVTGFGLETLKIEITRSGTVACDAYLRTTNYPNIYVCGDVAGPYQFTHTASHQAWYAVVNALFSPLKSYKVDYRIIPWCTFTDPEVARVGLNELEAKQKSIEYQISMYPLDDLDRAITENEAKGFVKVLTAKHSDKILGVTIVGSHAGEIITEFVAAMKHGFGLNKMLGTVHIYPTFAEANKYAAGVWKRANAPASALRWLEKFHRWRRR